MLVLSMGKRVTIHSVRELANLLNEAFRSDVDFEVYSDALYAFFEKKGAGSTVYISILRRVGGKEDFEQTKVSIPSNVRIQLFRVSSFITDKYCGSPVDFPIKIESDSTSVGTRFVTIEELEK